MYCLISALEKRPSTENSPVHIINIDIQDNHEEATIGAFLVCELVTKACVKLYYYKFFNFIIICIFSDGSDHLEESDL